MPTITSDERLGTLLEGKYRLDRILGEGGMGVVFAGEHTRLKRPIAVKFLHAHVATNADARRRFLREAESAAMLKHPNVVDVMDVGESPDGSAFMVLEFLRGDALADRIEKGGRMSEAQAADYLIPVLHAVGYAHSNGIVHRDLKPDNIFLSRGPNDIVIPKVLDFGIAKMLDAGGASATQTGSIMGTPLYMSPEQANGLKTLGPPADVWSLGVILFECVTGRLPWDFPSEPTLPMILVTIATRPASPILTVDSSITPELAAIIDRCLIPDVSRRFADANEVARALEAIRPRLRTAASQEGGASTAVGLAPAALGLLATQASLPPGTLGGGPRASEMPTLAASDGVAASAYAAAPDRTKPSSHRPPAPTPVSASPGVITAEIAARSGLPTATVSTPIRSMTRALWAIAAVAALALVGGVVAFVSRPPAPAPAVAVTPPPAAVPAPAETPTAPTPVAPAAVPAPAETPTAPASTASSATTGERRPRTTSATAGTTATATAATTATTATQPRVERPVAETRPVGGSSAMRRCANGVCSDLGGL